VTDRKGQRPGLRVAFVRAPPLLIDVIQTALLNQLGMAIVAEIAEINTAQGVLAELTPDVVIVGPSDNFRRLSALFRPLLPSARVLAISADLLQLAGPGDDDVAEFTLENLAQRLRR
jgi:hypothetical protein